MEIKINRINEYEFIPEIEGNEKEKKEKQWRIVVRKVNFLARMSKYAYQKSDGSTSYDDIEYMSDSIVRFENAPMLLIEGEKVELTKEMFLSDKFPVLFPVVKKLSDFINELLQDGIDTKK